MFEAIQDSRPFYRKPSLNICATQSCANTDSAEDTVTSLPGSFSAYTTLPWSTIIAYRAVRSPLSHPRLLENAVSVSDRKSCPKLATFAAQCQGHR